MDNRGSFTKLGNKTLQNYAKIKSQKIQEGFKNAIENLANTNKELILLNQNAFLKTLDSMPTSKIINEKGNIKMSAKLESAFLNDKGLIEAKKLNDYATPLPTALDEKAFKNHIKTNSEGWSVLETPIGDVKINVNHAWRHLEKGNTYKKDRREYSGAFFDTLADPLFVVKQEYPKRAKLSANAKDNAKSKWIHSKSEDIIAQDSYVFFKPYKTSNDFVYLVGYALDIEGKIINTTYMPLGKNDFGRIKKMIKGEDRDLLYFKGENYIFRG